MICTSCGVNNKDENKFCINCGGKLVEKENTSPNDCPSCGTENEEANKFCISCGHKLNQKSEPKKNNSQQNIINTSNGKNQKSKKQLRREPESNFNGPSRRQERKQARNISGIINLKLLWIIVGVVIGAVIIVSAFDLIFSPQTKDTPVELRSSNPVVEAKVFEIASKFVCSCGDCGEDSLDSCTCERAAEERQFIRNYLEQNQKSEDIIVAVANKYGWMKAEFASTYNVDASKVWNPNQLQISNNIIPPISTAPATSNTKATISDKYTIYSAFNCPCGQCGIDELKDCNCPHPNGAKEVKKFIDEKINENKYTMSDIIELVDKKYGGKKI